MLPGFFQSANVSFSIMVASKPESIQVLSYQRVGFEVWAVFTSSPLTFSAHFLFCYLCRPAFLFMSDRWSVFKIGAQPEKSLFSVIGHQNQFIYNLSNQSHLEGKVRPVVGGRPVSEFSQSRFSLCALFYFRPLSVCHFLFLFFSLHCDCLPLPGSPWASPGPCSPDFDSEVNLCL